VRNRTVMENRKFKGERLPRWEASLVANPVFFLAAVGAFE